VAAIIGVFLSMTGFVFNKVYYEFSINSINENFSAKITHSFLADQESLKMSHEGTKSPSDEKYCYFISNPIKLSPKIKKGCILRVGSIKAVGNGLSGVSKKIAGFDFEVYISPEINRKKFNGCEQWRREANLPSYAAGGDIFPVMVRSVISTKSTDGVDGRVPFGLNINFDSEVYSASPVLKSIKEIRRTDIIVMDSDPLIQIFGWTLWGEEFNFSFEDLVIEVRGRLQCGLNF
jgi:hypothetical protein